MIKNILILILLSLITFTFVLAQSQNRQLRPNNGETKFETIVGEKEAIFTFPITPPNNCVFETRLLNKIVSERIPIVYKAENNDLGTQRGSVNPSEISEFEVAIGRTTNGFSYSRKGSLMYGGKNFSPNVMANISAVSSFKISLLKSKNLAAAISIDGDGQNKLFLLDLSSLTSTPMQQQGKWNAAQKVFWSPSERYMVALCAYEGERFIRIDLTTKKVLEGDFLVQGNKIWSIKDEPHWIASTDVLGFSVEETCNPYDDPNCTGDRINKVLATHELGVDAASLKISSKPQSNKNIWVYNANPERTLQNKPFNELKDFIVVLTKVKQNQSKPIFKYTITVLGVNDTKNSNTELETVSLQAVIHRDTYILLDSPRTFRNINRGGVGTYRNLIAEFSGTGKDPGWEDLSIASAKFEGQELAAKEVIAGIGVLFGLYTEFSVAGGAAISKGVAVVDAIQYVAQLSNDLLSLTVQAPTILPSAEYTKKLRDINEYKVLDFGATKLKKNIQLLSLLESVNAVRFEFIVNELDGKEPSFFIKAKNAQNKIIGIEIGSNRSIPKVLSTR